MSQQQRKTLFLFLLILASFNGLLLNVRIAQADEPPNVSACSAVDPFCATNGCGEFDGWLCGPGGSCDQVTGNKGPAVCHDYLSPSACFCEEQPPDPLPTPTPPPPTPTPIPTPTPTPLPSGCQNDSQCGDCRRCCAGSPNYCSSLNYDCAWNLIPGCVTPTSTPAPAPGVCTPGEYNTVCTSTACP